MFWQMVIIEQQKIFKRAILWVELGLLAMGVVLLYFLLYSTTKLSGVEGVPPEAMTQIEQMLTWPTGLINSVSFASGAGFGGLLIIILVGAIIAQEYTWRTLQLWLSQGVSRPVLLGAKFVGILLPILLIVLTPVVVGGLVTAVLSQVLNGSIPFAEVEWGQLAWNILLNAYTLLPYAALAFLLAVVSRSTIVAIGGGLAYALVVEGIVIQILGLLGEFWLTVSLYLPAGLSRSLLASNAGLTVQVNGSPIPQPELLSVETAALGIALYVALFVGLAMLVFRRQDLGQ